MRVSKFNFPYSLENFDLTIRFHQFSFQVTPNNYAKLREIKELLRLMLDAVSEKLILKPLEKYGARLDELIALDPSLQQQEDKNNETAEGETAEAAASADETAAPGMVTITIFFSILFMIELPAVVYFSLSLDW